MKSLLTAITDWQLRQPVAVAESATKNALLALQIRVSQKAQPVPHAMDQRGNSAAADYPKLAGQHASYLASTLRAYRDGSRENAIMAGLAAVLSDEDIADLSVYYATQSVSSGAVQPDLLERGEQLYRFGDSEKGISACAACHGPTGAGLASAVFPSLKGQWAGYSETQLRSFRDGLRMNVMMSGVAKNMSDADIEAVSSYVEGLK